MTNTVKHSVTWRNVPLRDCELYELYNAVTAFESAIKLHDQLLDQDNLNDHQVTAIYRARENDKKALDAVNQEIAYRAHCVALPLTPAFG